MTPGKLSINNIFVQRSCNSDVLYGTDKDIYMMVYRPDSKPYRVVFINRLCNPA